MVSARLACSSSSLNIRANASSRPTCSSATAISPGASGLARSIALENGRIKVDGEGRTSLAKVWAGGDCVIDSREDLTVSAVAAGRDAAESIHRTLMG